MLALPCALDAIPVRCEEPKASSDMLGMEVVDGEIPYARPVPRAAVNMPIPPIAGEDVEENAGELVLRLGEATVEDTSEACTGDRLVAGVDTGGDLESCSSGS